MTENPKSPVISVIMPVFNGAEFLPAAIDSILNQSFNDFELLIDSTASTDGADEIVADYAKKDKRIIHANNGVEQSMPQKLNHMIKMAKGQYIARMDGDDISLPERFAKQIEYFSAHPEIGVLGTNVVRIDKKNNITDEFICMEGHDEIAASIIDGVSGIGHPTAMIRSDLFKKIGDYRSYFPIAEDLDLWLRLLRVGCRFANLKEVLFHYRFHENQTTKEKWRDMSLLSVLLKLNHREVMAGRADIFDNLEPKDINDQLVQKFSRAGAETVNNYFTVLFGLLSETAHKKNNDLLQETAFVIAQIIENASGDHLRKQVIASLAKLQCRVKVLPLPFCHFFYQIYVGFLSFSQEIANDKKEIILQKMVESGMKDEAQSLQMKWQEKKQEEKK